MRYLKTGLVGTARKENETRLPVHPRHLERIPETVRAHLVLEQGYGERFGPDQRRLQELGLELAGRDELLGSCDVIVLPKPLPEDLLQMKQGGTLWGWPHCVQQRQITQVAIDRRLTLLAFEAMYRWRRHGEPEVHIFYKNNELAGYCSVLHALELRGLDGFYGPSRRAVVLGFGSVSRGAIYALQGRGFTDITVLTQRPPHLVRDQVFGCRYGRMGQPSEPAGAMLVDLGHEPATTMVEELATADLIVNGTLQDTDRPLMYLREGEEELLAPGCLIVDVSCDEGMGFTFARPTSFEAPILRVGTRNQLTYYAVDHSPSYLWDSATWEISLALLPYLETVMRGSEAWANEPTVERCIEIRDGVIQNDKILSFQGRSPEFPHEVASSS